MNNLLEQNIEANIGKEKYYVEVKWRNGVLIMDEPTTIDGKDLGPDPYSTLLASLAGCTLSTLRMYIDRKGWDVPEIKVSINMYKDTESPATIITRDIEFPANMNIEYEERLLEIAKKCPVSKILEGKIIINTTT